MPMALLFSIFSCVVLLLALLALRHLRSRAPARTRAAQAFKDIERRASSPKTILVKQQTSEADDDREPVVHEMIALDKERRLPLSIDRLEPVRPIGMGGQGGVWLALDPGTGFTCALKQVRKGRLTTAPRNGSKGGSCQWLVERQALLELGEHPFITTCYACFQDATSLFYALELASAGDLFGLLHARGDGVSMGTLTEEHARFVAARATHSHAHSLSATKSYPRTPWNPWRA